MCQGCGYNHADLGQTLLVLTGDGRMTATRHVIPQQVIQVSKVGVPKCHPQEMTPIPPCAFQVRGVLCPADVDCVSNMNTRYEWHRSMRYRDEALEIDEKDPYPCRNLDDVLPPHRETVYIQNCDAHTFLSRIEPASKSDTRCYDTRESRSQAAPASKSGRRTG